VRVAEPAEANGFDAVCVVELLASESVAAGDVAPAVLVPADEARTLPPLVAALVARACAAGAT
jgi:hypothetical protein